MSKSERVNVDDSILDALLSETSHDISQQELRFIAYRALGCVGAVIHSNSLRTTLPAHCRPFLKFLFFDTLPIRYSDIGGKASTIQKLREAASPLSQNMYEAGHVEGVDSVAVKGLEVSSVGRFNQSHALIFSCLTTIE